MKSNEYNAAEMRELTRCPELVMNLKIVSESEQ